MIIRSRIKIRTRPAFFRHDWCTWRCRLGQLRLRWEWLRGSRWHLGRVGPEAVSSPGLFVRKRHRPRPGAWFKVVYNIGKPSFMWQSWDRFYHYLFLSRSLILPTPIGLDYQDDQVRLSLTRVWYSYSRNSFMKQIERILQWKCIFKYVDLCIVCFNNIFFFCNCLCVQLYVLSGDR